MYETILIIMEPEDVDRFDQMIIEQAARIGVEVVKMEYDKEVYTLTIQHQVTSALFYFGMTLSNAVCQQLHIKPSLPKPW